MDADSKHGVFAYHENAAHAYHICELCGGQTDKQGESVAPVNDHESFVVVVRALCEWGCETLAHARTRGTASPKHFYVMAVKVCNPAFTMDQVGQMVGLTRSHVCDIYSQIVERFPEAAKLFGRGRKGSEV
jgi:hypothetical protein